jgi:hypothetical protein
MRKHLTQPVPMPRWWIYLVLLGFALIDIANENWLGLAIYVTAGIASYWITRLWLKHRHKHQDEGTSPSSTPKSPFGI